MKSRHGLDQVSEELPLAGGKRQLVEELREIQRTTLSQKPRAVFWEGHSGHQCRRLQKVPAHGFRSMVALARPVMMGRETG